MQFTDSGIILSIRKFNEHGGIVQVLTEHHGLHAGVDRYAFSSKRRGTYQPGNRVQVVWTARLAEQLGTFTTEMVEPVAASVMDDRLKLSLLQSACHLAGFLLNEREPQGEVYDGFMNLVQKLRIPSGHDALLVSYILLELTLLKTAGFGLDLASCAATGVLENLLYVSPRSGQAVSEGAGEAYRDKLFRLPAFLLPNAQKSAVLQQDLLDALRLTGYFLETRALAAKPGKLPHTRERIVNMLKQEVSISKTREIA